MRKNIEEMIFTNPDTGKSSINILPAIIEPLSMNKRMRKKIDVIYNKNKAECHKLAKENYYYDFPLFSNGDVVKEEYCRRLLGVHLLSDINHEVFEIMLRSYKQVYPLIYKHIEENEQIDFKEIIKISIKTNIKDFVPDMEITEVFCICILLCDIFERKMIEDECFEVHHNEMLFRFATYFSKLERKVLHHKGLLSDYFVDTAKVFNNEYFDRELRNKVKQVKGRVLERTGTNSSEIHLYPEYQIGEDMELIRIAIRLIMESEGLCVNSFLADYKFNEKDIDEIIATYYYIYNNQNVTSILEFISYIFPIKILSKEYVSLKKRYFKNHKENLCLEMEEQNNKIQELVEENNRLNKNLNEANSKISNLRIEYKKGLEREIFKLNKTKNKLEEKNQELIEEKKELIALREYLFNKDNNSYNPNDSEIEVPSIRAIIFGGHENWQDRLKGELPETFRFESGINERFDERILDNVEMIFLNVESCMSHAVYYKIMSCVRKKDIKVEYINSTNIEISSKEIVRKIKSQVQNSFTTAC